MAVPLQLLCERHHAVEEGVTERRACSIRRLCEGDVTGQATPGASAYRRMGQV